jgi:hypothetical protein
VIRVPVERLDDHCDVFRSPDFRSYDCKAEFVRRVLNLAHLSHGAAIANIAQHRQPAESGHNLAQQLQALSAIPGAKGYWHKADIEQVSDGAAVS